MRAHRGLACKVATRWVHQCGIEFEELESIALVGLSRAIDEYDPTTGNAFSSLAVVWINGEIMHFLRDHGTLLKVPRITREKAARVRREHERLCGQGLGKRFSLADVAFALLQIPPEEWQWMESATAPHAIAPLEEDWQYYQGERNSNRRFSDDPEYEPLQMAIASLDEESMRLVIKAFYEDKEVDQTSDRLQAVLERLKQELVH